MMIVCRRFSCTALLLMASSGLLTSRSLGAQIAVNGTATVTFNVPVQLASLDPKFTEVDVECFVQPRDNGVWGPSAKGKAPLTNGAFSGTVPVKVTFAPFSNRGIRYYCQFSLLDSATGKDWVFGDPNSALGPNDEGLVTWLAKPGTTPKYQSGGSFDLQ